jgi:outer membrane receptor for ferrienterochelin and colicin
MTCVSLFIFVVSFVRHTNFSSYRFTILWQFLALAKQLLPFKRYDATQLHTFFTHWYFFSYYSKCSKDTLTGTGDEIVVTGTRTERKLSNVAVPTKIISRKTIQQAGSLRLSDVLQEQAGLFLTSGFGVGVQMQGLNPDYTMIMINGEPLVGRTSGVLI